jgi:hypothetical protein
MPENGRDHRTTSRRATYGTGRRAFGTPTVRKLPNSRLPILPRSLHLPVGVTEGSLIENLNKIGVRLWTGYSRMVAESKRWDRILD